MTDHEAQELLRLSHIERKLRGYLKAFADELDALACSLGHRAPDRVAADMRDISNQMEVVAGGSTSFVNGWIQQRAEDEARRQEVTVLKRRSGRLDSACNCVQLLVRRRRWCGIEIRRTHNRTSFAVSL